VDSRRRPARAGADWQLRHRGAAAGLAAIVVRVMARTDREPWPDIEFRSRRSYLLARRW